MRLFGLIGYPLSHSFSKTYFSEKFERERITGCTYENFAIRSIEEFPELWRQHPELEGLNITIPYKEQVVPFLTGRSDVVRSIGACNCISRDERGLSGYNTDVPGFERSLRKKLQPAHRRALVLGTGGASKAVQYTLVKLNIPFLVVSRSNTGTALTYAELTPEVVFEHPLIINTTPIGMYPEVNDLPPLPYEAIGKGHFLFDLVYNPPLTKFLEMGVKQGAVIENGYEMLVNQAEESWMIWNQLT